MVKRFAVKLKHALVVVSVLAFYSNDPSSNPTEIYISSKIIVVTNENKQKEAVVGPLFF